MEKGRGDGAPPGEAKIALSRRRELNFEDITKQHDFWEKSEIALSCRREGQNEERMGRRSPNWGGQNRALV